MKLYVLGNAHREGVAEEAERLVPELRRHFEVLVVDLRQEVDLDALPRADIALVLGGDGAILRAARQMGYRQVPVLGVNLGQLGFLADVTPEQARCCLPQLLAGEYHLTHHVMYECTVVEIGNDGQPRESRTLLGLNEVVVHTLPPFPILDLDLSIDGEQVARFRGDGLILSTPIGSTAHSLSAGGPILSQELQAFVLTPICPHTLTYRPVVESADRVYTIVMAGRSRQAALIADGQDVLTLTPAHRITLRRAPVQFSLVKVPGRTFYHTLRDKLRWAVLPNYRHEP